MTQKEQQQLGKTLWDIADNLRGAMNPDDFRDYMLSFLFLRYLSFNYEESAKKELGRDYPLENLFINVDKTDLEIENEKKFRRNSEGTDKEIKIEKTKKIAISNLGKWYFENPDEIQEFEKQMRRKVHYVVEPNHLWSNITELARTQNADLLVTLENGFRYIENESFESAFQGLFSEINLNSEKLGKTATERNKKLCTIIQKISDGIADFSADSDTLGDA